MPPLIFPMLFAHSFGSVGKVVLLDKEEEGDPAVVVLLLLLLAVLGGGVVMLVLLMEPSAKDPEPGEEEWLRLRLLSLSLLLD